MEPTIGAGDGEVELVLDGLRLGSNNHFGTPAREVESVAFVDALVHSISDGYERKSGEAIGRMVVSRVGNPDTLTALVNGGRFVGWVVIDTEWVLFEAVEIAGTGAQTNTGLCPDGFVLFMTAEATSVRIGALRTCHLGVRVGGTD